MTDRRLDFQTVASIYRALHSKLYWAVFDSWSFAAIPCPIDGFKEIEKAGIRKFTRKIHVWFVVVYGYNNKKNHQNGYTMLTLCKNLGDW